MRVTFMTGTLVALILLSPSLVTALPSVTQQPPSHNYTFNELRPQRGSNGSFRQPYFRFKVFFRKNTGITEEFFHRHWKTIHADLTISGKNAGLRLLRYTQVSGAL
jgi:hypothetical protein